MATKMATHIVSGAQDEDVIAALDMASEESYDHNKQETVRRIIQDLFKSGCEISSPNGKDVISSKMIMTILWGVANKMKIPDFQIKRAGPFKLTTDKAVAEKEATTRSWAEQLITAGVSTVMKEGGFVDAMRGKSGAF